MDAPPIRHLRARKDATIRLPPPSDPKPRSELAPALQDAFEFFCRIGVLVELEIEDAPNQYHATPECYHYAQYLDEDRATHACGHAGIRREDGVFTCTQTACGIELDEADIQAYLKAAEQQAADVD